MCLYYAGRSSDQDEEFRFFFEQARWHLDHLHASLLMFTSRPLLNGRLND